MQDFLSQLTPHLYDLLGVVLTFAISAAAMKLRQLTSINIEAKHREALHEAIMSGVTAAIQDGPQAGLDTVADAAIAHARASVPDAISALGPSTAVLRNIARRYAAQ